MDNIDPADETVFSPAALKIIRRHKPDPEDGRFCRACGRPVGACDVLALARAVAAVPQAAQTLAKPAAAPTRDGGSVYPGQAPASVTGSARQNLPRHPGRRRTDRAPIEA